MKYHKVILAGGNGYLGNVLASYYSDLATEIIVLSRKAAPLNGNIRTVVWNGVSEGEWQQALEGAELLVNLCGKNVNCRYTEKNKAEIISSRVDPTKLLGKVIAKLSSPPELWINIASATIYRHAEDHPQDEETGDTGYGFSVEVCKIWEKTFFETSTPSTRKIALRMGIVLGRNDGVFPRLLNLVKFGLGGKQGDGEQYVAWVHEQDVANSIEWLNEHKELNPFGLPSPIWLLELGAMVIGTETELILKSRWVLPKRLTDSGYEFLFKRAGYAVKDILSFRI